MRPTYLGIFATLLILGASATYAESDLDLAKKSGCLACHSIEKKVVGPSWKDVSARYKDESTARAELIDKIKTGTKGAWTDQTGGVPMPPYSPRVSDPNIEQLVDFILQL